MDLVGGGTSKYFNVGFLGVVFVGEYPCYCAWGTVDSGVDADGGVSDVVFCVCYFAGALVEGGHAGGGEG